MFVPMRKILRDAEKNAYAVGYFEAFNMDALLACLDAAIETRSPIIIGFGGQFLSSPKRKEPENIYLYGALAKAAAEHSDIPVATLLNESDRIDMVYQGMKAGFGAVMYQKEPESEEDTLRITREVCKVAHYLNIDVESEVGRLPMQNIATGTADAGQNTDVAYAKKFVSETDIDALAVAIGNVHLLESSKADLDFDLLKSLHANVPVPLVLHGGTGISDEDIKKAIRLGITKMNVGTVLKRCYINALKPFYKEKEIDKIDTHVTIGWGGNDDMISAGRDAIRDKIHEFIEVFGSAGMAKHF
ncbi:fructose-bisphosphate aldolase [Clostridia bacterium]|nr:fructose-bisphosphate aldolase [Clostridia bacterium]